MTWITCDKCGYTSTVSFMDVVFNPETGEHTVSSPKLKWKCPECGGNPELDVVTIFSKEDAELYQSLSESAKTEVE